MGITPEPFMQFKMEAGEDWEVNQKKVRPSGVSSNMEKEYNPFSSSFFPFETGRGHVYFGDVPCQTGTDLDAFSEFPSQPLWIEDILHQLMVNIPLFV